MKNINFIIISSAIIFLILISYSNSLKNEFVWDDGFLITENPTIKSWDGIGKIFTHNLGYASGNKNNYYRPMQELSYVVDYSIWHLQPFGYHLTNISIHIFNALLLLWLIYLFSQSEIIAALSAIFFAVHPINTSVVTYIAGRADSLYVFFMLISILSFTAFLKQTSLRRVSYYCISILSFMLALLSKEAAIMLPFLLILSSYAFTVKTIKKDIFFKALSPFFVILAAYLWLHSNILSSELNISSAATAPLFIRLFTACKAIFIYLKILILPIDLHMWRNIAEVRSIFEPAVLLSVVTLLALFINLPKIYKHSKLIFFGACFFLINLIPIANVIPLSTYIAENWTYLASIGLFVVIAAAVINFYNEVKNNFVKFCILAVISLFIIYCIGLTIKRNFDWKDNFTIFSQTLEYAPNSSVVNLGLAMAYEEKGKIEKAISTYKNVPEDSEQSAHAHNNLGAIYRKKNSLSEAIEEYKKSRDRNPKYMDARLNLAATYVIIGELDNARIECQAAIGIDPNFAASYVILGDAYSIKKLYQEAITAYQKAISINPFDVYAHKKLKAVYMNIGDTGKAAEEEQVILGE